jgi:hypothetical protein
MSIAQWYNKALKEIKDEYDQASKELNEKRIAKIEELNKEHYEQAASCTHKWIHKRSLFYFCGETYDGHECSECLSVRRSNEKLNKVGNLKKEMTHLAWRVKNFLGFRS